MMKAVFIGCVQFSHVLFAELIASDAIKLTGVVTRRSSSFNADFQSLEPAARDAGIPCLNIEGNDQELLMDWIAGIGPEVIFCFGWSYLLDPQILAVPKYGVIGYHPALLPRNRGRHPIVWALALGMKETGSTFFFMDDGADSGDIISQSRIVINDNDDAATLYKKLEDAARVQLDALITDLVAHRLQRVPQIAALATKWRKRSKRDGEIEWRMSAVGIFNLVRALTRPYVGAHCVHNGNELKVWRVIPVDAPDTDVEPGRVLAANDGAITVKCGDGAVTLTDHEFFQLPEVGTSL
jgi:methionyl-tRNA formyltransferase